MRFYDQVTMYIVHRVYYHYYKVQPLECEYNK